MPDGHSGRACRSTDDSAGPGSICPRRRRERRVGSGGAGRASEPALGGRGAWNGRPLDGRGGQRGASASAWRARRQPRVLSRAGKLLEAASTCRRERRRVPFVWYPERLAAELVVCCHSQTSGAGRCAPSATAKASLRGGGETIKVVSFDELGDKAASRSRAATHKGASSDRRCDRRRAVDDDDEAGAFAASRGKLAPAIVPASAETGELVPGSQSKRAEQQASIYQPSRWVRVGREEG